MDPRLSLYMERTVDVLVTAGAEDLETNFEELDETEAVMEATIRFPQGHRLEVDLLITISGNKPTRRVYSFHFMDNWNTTVFRYDNARHHQNLENFPHHKHEGMDERLSVASNPP